MAIDIESFAMYSMKLGRIVASFWNEYALSSSATGLSPVQSLPLHVPYVAHSIQGQVSG
jgi:hypothetical protein